MKKLLFFFIFTVLTMTVKAQSVPMVFQDWVTEKGTQYFYIENKVVTDAYGSVYIVGATHNGIDYDILVVKYNSKGQLEWTQQYDSYTGDDIGIGLLVDGNQNVYITGTVSTGSNTDIVTIKYDYNGTQEWVSTYNGSGDADDAGIDLMLYYNDVYLTGYITDTTGMKKLVVVSYDSIGDLNWATAYNYAANLNGAGVRINKGNPWGLGTGEPVVSGCVQIDSITYRHCEVYFSANGGIKSAYVDTVSNYTGVSRVSDMVQDASSNIYIAASVYDVNNGYDYAVIKLDSSLNILWERGYNGSSGLDD
jgi:hypothetical protein